MNEERELVDINQGTGDLVWVIFVCKLSIGSEPFMRAFPTQGSQKDFRKQENNRK